MECKLTKTWRCDGRNQIRLVPYWNVNNLKLYDDTILQIIRLVPYWNVNRIELTLEDVEGEIRLVPYWNVNQSPVTELEGIIALD